jgi:iron complex transport system substrate-binding protein
MSSPRVVSLLAAGTEIVCALGGVRRLVGISHECDWPAGIEGLPRLTRPRIDPRATGGAIDREIRALVAGGSSPYEVDADALRDLRPDVLITQDQCEVCAVSPRDLEAALKEWVGSARVEIVSLRPFLLEDVWRDFLAVGKAIGFGFEAEDLVSRCRERLNQLRQRVADRARPRCVVLEWMDPIFVAAGWTPELVEIAGGEPVGTRAGQKSPQMDWEEVVELRPDVLVIAPCGYPLEKTLGELQDLTDREGWQQLSAVRDGRTWVADGNALLHRSGPRLVESAELLSEIFHPDEMPAVQGPAWARRIA